jgi:indolepyruvate ferredoxin oxidoreductase
MERQLIEDYIVLLEQILARLAPANHAAAVALASVPDEIRGYGHVKEKSVALARELQAERMKAFLEPQQERQAA